MDNTQPTLFDAKRHLETPVAHARRSDPPTSKAAAASVKHISELQLEILKAYKAFGPMADEDLVRRITGHGLNEFGIAASDASIRSRRAELVRTHGLVVDTGKTSPTKCGRKATVWGIAEAKQ